MRFFLLLLFWAGSLAAASAASDTLKITSGVSDYGPLMQSKLLTLANSGGGTLYVKYGVYPTLTPVSVNFQSATVTLSVVGIPNATGDLPLLIDTDSTKNPHSFLSFAGHITNLNLSVRISNLAMKGNNVAYRVGQHPFWNISSKSYSSGININNSKSAQVENVRIENVYGNGIAITNWFDNKQKLGRCESPYVKNCFIKGCWAYNSPADDTGDGIIFWSCNKPLAENNTIINDLTVDRMFGRAAIVVEHYCDQAVLRNNYMVGFMRTIHIECDYGGHLVENNTGLQCDNGVVFSQDCGQTLADSAKYSRSIVRNNSFTYANETELYNLPKGDRSFISFWKANYVLKGLRVENNKFYWGTDIHTVFRITEAKRKAIMYDFVGQDAEIITSGNTLEIFDISKASETPTISVRDNKAFLSTTSKARIFYTTDGSTPTAKSPVYLSPVALGKAVQLRAVALEKGKTVSLSSSYLSGSVTSSKTGLSKLITSSLSETQSAGNGQYRGMRVTVGSTPILLERIGRKATTFSTAKAVLIREYYGDQVVYAGELQAGTVTENGYQYLTLPSIRLERGRSYYVAIQENDSYYANTFASAPVSNDLRIERAILNASGQRDPITDDGKGAVLDLQYSRLERERSQNLALGRAATMLSAHTWLPVAEWKNLYYATNAVDGDSTTAAITQGEYRWVLKLDLGSVKPVQEVRVSFDPGFFSTEFDLLYSTDDVNRSVILKKNNPSGKLRHRLEFMPVNARYIYLFSHKPFDWAQPGFRMGIREFEVY